MIRFLSLLLVVLIIPVSGHWRRWCHTKNLPLVKVGLSASNDSLVVLDRWEVGDAEAPDLDSLQELGFVRQRQLQLRRGLHWGGGYLVHEHEDATTNGTHLHAFEWDKVYYAKQCTCFLDLDTTDITLCPLATEDCREVVNNHVPGFPRTTHCYDRNIKEKRLNQVAMYVWVFFLGLLLMTHKGRSALSYIPAKICRCWNPIVASISLKYRKKFSYFLIRNHILVTEEALLRQVQRQADSNTDNNTTTANTDGITAIEMATMSLMPPPPKLPTKLLLKTRTVQQEELDLLIQQQAQDPENDPDVNDIDNDSLELLCAICLAEIKPGNKVGDFRNLDCKHLFHAECLKLWLQRRNACPLCQAKEVAEPKYEDEDDKDPETSARTTATQELSTRTTTTQQLSTQDSNSED